MTDSARPLLFRCRRKLVKYQYTIRFYAPLDELAEEPSNFGYRLFYKKNKRIYMIRSMNNNICM